MIAPVHEGTMTVGLPQFNGFSWAAADTFRRSLTDILSLNDAEPLSP